MKLGLPKNKKEPKLILNLIHRVGTSEREFLQLQQDYAHQLKLKVSLMVQVDAMQDPETVLWIQQNARDFGDEIGLSLTLGYDSPEFRQQIGGIEEFLWLYSSEEKRFIIEMAIGYFRRTFGRNPVSVASYHFDSVCMQILHEVCPSIKIAVAGCFEEGVKVFHGCNHSWYLFNEGMPWGPWYPSQTHSLRPAESEEDWCGIIGVPHLSRDPALSYEGRNDFFASHPANAQRGLANVGYEHPYDYNLCDLYRLQEDYNEGFSYYNIFVSPGWLAGHPTIQDPNEVSQKLYYDLLEYCAMLRDQGHLIDMTMSEFAGWYRANWPVGKPEVFLAKEMLYGSGKHYLWYVDPGMRLLVDTNQGGSIGDLRPFIGKTPVATGRDQPAMWYGSYPYVIQSQYRSGMAHHYLDGARTTLFVTYQSENIDLGTCKTRVASIERIEACADGLPFGTRVTLTPAHLKFQSGLIVDLETVLEIKEIGVIEIIRRLVSISDPSAVLTLREQLKGCYGVTEYPEDLHGARLAVQGDRPQELEFAYQRRQISTPQGLEAAVVLPQITTRVSLEAQTPALSAQAIEGLLFSPYYTLVLEYEIAIGKEVCTCLKLSYAK